MLGALVCDDQPTPCSLPSFEVNIRVTCRGFPRQSSHTWRCH